MNTQELFRQTDQSRVYTDILLLYLLHTASPNRDYISIHKTLLTLNTTDQARPIFQQTSETIFTETETRSISDPTLHSRAHLYLCEFYLRSSDILISYYVHPRSAVASVYKPISPLHRRDGISLEIPYLPKLPRYLLVHNPISRYLVTSYPVS